MTVIELPHVEMSIVGLACLPLIGFVLGRLRQRAANRLELRRADRHVQEMAEEMAGAELDMQEARRAVLAAKEELRAAEQRDALRKRQVQDLMDALNEHHMDTTTRWWLELEGGTQ